MHTFNASKAPVYFQHYSEVIPNSADLDSQAIISIAEKLGNAKTIDSPSHKWNSQKFKTVARSFSEPLRMIDKWVKIIRSVWNAD